MRVPFLPFVVVGGLACLSGCEGPKAQGPVVVRPAVQLPESPPLEEDHFPEKAPDGSFTVAGLMSGGPDRLGNGVRVTGAVLERHTCKDKPEGTLCPPPYLILVDGLERPATQVMVVGTEEQIRTVEEGESTFFSGTFQQWSDDRFYIRSTGLVQLKEETPDKP